MRRLDRTLRLPALALVATACASLSLGSRRAATWWGFTAPWDTASASSLRRHAAALDAAVTGWIALDSVTGQPRRLFPDTAGRDAGVPRMAIVTTFLGDRFHPLAIRQLAGDPAALARAAGAIASYARESRYTGLVLDFEMLAPSDVPALVRVANAIADSAHAHGVSPVAIAIPATDSAGYPAAPLLAAVDLLVVMLYDEHWTSSGPGPIASPDWVRRALGARVAEVGADRLVAGLPLYGYRWRREHLTEVLTYDEAQRLAGAAGLRLERDPASSTLRARRTDDPNNEWEIWVSDADLVRALMTLAQDVGVRRFALWRLGGEDERIWSR